MIELPFDRLQEEPLFIYCRVDLFWIFHYLRRTKRIKTCDLYRSCLFFRKSFFSADIKNVYKKRSQHSGDEA